MNHRKDWQIPIGGTRAWRTGASALALLSATAACSVLLAWRFHLGVVAVVVGILCGLPGLYLAWAAYRAGLDDKREPVPGKPIASWNPADLGVHRVIGGGPMPTYVRRRHDDLLPALLDPAVPASRLVVLRGGSSTGKSRAAYEAVLDRLPDWRLDYPLTAATLAERVDVGIGRRTVLWLGELRHYVDDANGPGALGRLADLLSRDGQLVVITTIWPEHWHAYIAATGRHGPAATDPVDVAGRLLTRLPELAGCDPTGIDPSRGGVIDIPGQFTSGELTEATLTGDRILIQAAQAACAAGSQGQVTQYLAGVPELRAQYDAPGGDPYGQAIIAVAMDAARLGCVSPLPRELLRHAVVGYLTDLQRSTSISHWWKAALAYATRELNGAVRAVEPVPPANGTGVVGYQIADYLDQHSRRTRHDILGPASLWDALAAHARSPRDLTRLGDAAHDRGLYRHAALFWTKAIAEGDAEAAYRLVRLLHRLDPNGARHADLWAARSVGLGDPGALTKLLKELHATGATDAATELASRAGHGAEPSDPSEDAWLLRALHEAGAADAVAELADRAVHDADLSDTDAVRNLLWALSAVGATDAETELASRAVRNADLSDTDATADLLSMLLATGEANAVTELADRIARADLRNLDLAPGLLEGLCSGGAADVAAILVARAARDADLSNAGAIAKLLWKPGATDAVTELAIRAVRDADLTDTNADFMLLSALRHRGATDAVTELANRAARDADLSDIRSLTLLLKELRTAGATDAVTELANRIARDADIGDPSFVNWLLDELRAAGATDAATRLTDRVISDADLSNPSADTVLMQALHEAGAADAVTRLANRAAREADLSDTESVRSLLRALHEAGTEDALAELADRAARGTDLNHAFTVAWLLQALHEAGAEDAVAELADRAAREADLSDPEGGTGTLLRALHKAGAADAVTELASRAVRDVDLSHTYAVAWLLGALDKIGATDSATVLADRAARDADVGDADAVGNLLTALHKARAADAVTELADRAARGTDLSNAAAIAWLVGKMRKAGAAGAAAILANRAARGVGFSYLDGVAQLLKALRKVGAVDAAAILTNRAADAGKFTIYLAAGQPSKYTFGREPTGSASPPWKWSAPANKASLKP